MQAEIIIRSGNPDEMEWINSQYEEIGFKRSDFENEFIAVAEVTGERAGLGRLQHIEPI